MRHTVVEGAAAVGGVGAHRIADAAAGGFPAAWHRNGVLVCGFVGKHVATREPRSAEGVRRLLEHRTEAVDDVSSKMESTHAVVLHIAGTVVIHTHMQGVACAGAVGNGYCQVTVVIINRATGVVHEYGIHGSGFQVEGEAGDTAQEPQIDVGVTREVLSHFVVDIEADAVIEHVHRVGGLCR